MIYKDIFSEFNRQKIGYVVLRNDEFLLDESLPTESLDISVAQADLPKIDAIFRKHHFTKRTQQFSLKHKAYFNLINTQIVSFDIQVGGIYWNDMRYLDESIFDRRKKKTFYYMLSNNDMAVMLIAHSILGKRYFKEKYKGILHKLDYNPEEVTRQLARIFSKPNAQRIIHSVRTSQFDIPIKKLVTGFIAKHPIIFTKLFFRWIAWKKPFRTYPLISIVGPDGAGKSTMVQSLQHYLESHGRKVATVYTGRGRGHILPITTVGRKYKTIEKLKGEENSSSIGKKILYTAAAPIFAADLWLRYVIRILPKRMNHIVITDRYCTDIMLMKHVTFGLKKFLVHLFPRPTISIYLHNSPEILHQRRPNEPIEELQRQMDLFQKFSYSLQLKTSSDKTETEAKQFVMSWLLRHWY